MCLFVCHNMSKIREYGKLLLEGGSKVGIAAQNVQSP